MIPTDEIRARLDGLGVEYEKPTSGLTVAQIGGVQYRFYEHVEPETNERYKNKVFVVTEWLTPEQAIAATVGGHTDLAKQLREVTGLHAFAELFGFSWEDGSDWTWHDVACAMVDAVDAATAGAGTCKNTQDDFDFMCSECGKCVDNGRVLGFKFCPQCGRKIKEEAE